MDQMTDKMEDALESYFDQRVQPLLAKPVKERSREERQFLSRIKQDVVGREIEEIRRIDSEN